MFFFLYCICSFYLGLLCYYGAFYSFYSSLSFNLLTIWQSDRCSGHGLWNGWRRSRKQKCPWKSNTGINLILSILWLLSLETFFPLLLHWWVHITTKNVWLADINWSFTLFFLLVLIWFNFYCLWPGIVLHSSSSVPIYLIIWLCVV